MEKAKGYLSWYTNQEKLFRSRSCLWLAITASFAKMRNANEKTLGNPPLTGLAGEETQSSKHCLFFGPSSRGLRVARSRWKSIERRAPTVQIQSPTRPLARSRR
jgi:hypothetical protein